MTQTYFRIQTADRDAVELIDPERAQVSYHWSGQESMDRPGVSVCATTEDLARYLATSGIPFGLGDWTIVELAGERVEDVTPFDAAFGELLIWPTEVVATRPLDDEFFDLIGAAYDAANGA